MKSVTAQTLHVPLPRELHDALRGEAERSGRPAAELACEAIESFLQRRSRLALHEAIAAYAVRVAGTTGDLDRQLERAGLEQLLDVEDV